MSTSGGPELPAGLQHLADPVLGFDETGSVIGWNESFADRAPVDPEEAFGGGEYARVRAAARQALEAGPQTIEVTLHTEGERRPAEMRLSVASEGSPVSVVGVCREQQDRSELEQRERALRRASTVLAQSDIDFEAKVDRLLGIVRETLGTEVAILSEVDGGSYHVRAFDGPEDAAASAGETVPLGTTTCERVVTSRETLVLESVEDTPEGDLSSYLGAPVLVEGEPYGTFCFYDRNTPVKFSEWEIAFVELLSDWLSSRLEERRLSERRYEQYLGGLLEHASDVVGVVDERGEYGFVSPAVERLFGHASDELLGGSILEYVHPEDRPDVEAFLDRVCNTPAETHSAEYRFRDASGNWRWVETRATDRRADPVIEGVLTSSRDITERKARERRLDTEQALTESIFQTLPDIFYAFDGSQGFLRWSDELAAVTGYTDEELAGMHPVECIAPADRQRVAETIADILDTGESVTVEADLQTKDGTRTPYEFSGARMTDDDGDTLGLVGVGRDITTRKRRQRQFEAIFNNTYQFTGLMDTDGTVLEANETALAFGGLDRDDVVGSKLWETSLFEGIDKACKAARAAVRTASQGDLYRDEITIQGKAGTEIIDFSVRPLFDESGEVSLLIPEGRLITELKQREKHLGVLHRLLRHNIRNKTAVIKSMSELVGAESEDAQLTDYANRMEKATDDLVALSETANNLSRVVVEADPDPEPVEVTQPLGGAVEACRDRYPSATLGVETADVPQVVADWRLAEAFEQLIENAIEHGGANQTVEISVEEVDDEAVVQIADDGPGIPPDERVAITDDETPTQLTHGSGLGLWLSQAVVGEHDGDVRYDSPPGYGAVIEVRLPLAGAQTPAVEPVP